MQIVFELNPSKEDCAALEQALFNFNRSKVEDYSYESIIIKAVGDADSTVAGIHAQIGGGWLYIASLWVEENCRKKGLGRKLVGLAEKVAVEKKCHGVYLYTYSFQNPRFYEKLGYGVFGTLEKFGGGHMKYFMKKNLA